MILVDAASLIKIRNSLLRGCREAKGRLGDEERRDAVTRGGAKERMGGTEPPRVTQYTGLGISVSPRRPFRPFVYRRVTASLLSSSPSRPFAHSPFLDRRSD